MKNYNQPEVTTAYERIRLELQRGCQIQYGPRGPQLVDIPQIIDTLCMVFAREIASLRAEYDKHVHLTPYGEPGAPPMEIREHPDKPLPEADMHHLDTYRYIVAGVGRRYGKTTALDSALAEMVKTPLDVPVARSGATHQSLPHSIDHLRLKIEDIHGGPGPEDIESPEYDRKRKAKPFSSAESNLFDQQLRTRAENTLLAITSGASQTFNNGLWKVTILTKTGEITALEDVYPKAPGLEDRLSLSAKLARNRVLARKVRRIQREAGVEINSLFRNFREAGQKLAAAKIVGSDGGQFSVDPSGPVTARVVPASDSLKNLYIKASKEFAEGIASTTRVPIVSDHKKCSGTCQWQAYEGLMQRYEFCTVCDDKRSL